MMLGANQGMMTGLRRLIAGAMARDLCGFVVPGPDVARARGLDFTSAGLHLAATPRHANVLVVVGPLPVGLLDAATVAYAQMPRPRAILTLGADWVDPLPPADATGSLTQDGLVGALAQLRRVLATEAFSSEVSDFDVPALQTRIEYTCPMHPEVLSDEPGNCPKCGMTLRPKETSAGGHSDHQQKESAPAHQPPVAAHAAHTAAEAPAQYTCPMHPEVLSDEPGNCPKCGMFLAPVEEKAVDHNGHASHTGHEGHTGGEVIHGIEPHFMSMVDLTRDMPASADGLKMEWIEVPFGPFFPGLPGGLGLSLTLDGDAVAETRTQGVVGEPIAANGLTPIEFADHFANLSPLSPVASRQLACLALENAAGITVDNKTATGRTAAVERERIASHLGWLASLATQTGLVWMERRATALQLSVQAASLDQILANAGLLHTFLHRLNKTPLLCTKLASNGRITQGDSLLGPVARAQGLALDARTDDAVYEALGFEVLTQDGDDALARLHQRCGEIGQSLDLIARAKGLSVVQIESLDGISGTGKAVVETPRGAARLTVEIDGGTLTNVMYHPPCAAHMELLGDMIKGQEIGDALVAIGSLDLSPWGLPA